MAGEVPPEVRPDQGISEPTETAPSIPLAPPKPAPHALPAPAMPAPDVPVAARRSKAVPIAIGAAILAVIVAVVAIAVAGTKKSSSAAHPSASASVVPPTGFTAIAQSFSITLNWVAPAGETVTSYQIIRNGTFRAMVDAPATTYTDVAVMRGSPTPTRSSPRLARGPRARSP